MYPKGLMQTRYALASQMAADARQAFDHNHSSTQARVRREAEPKRSARTLSPVQNDRYLEVLEAAKSLCKGDLDASMRRVSHPLKALDGKAPASMVAIRLETDTVIEFTRRLEHGFVA